MRKKQGEKRRLLNFLCKNETCEDENMKKVEKIVMKLQRKYRKNMKLKKEE
jgi:hypothetical protein